MPSPSSSSARSSPATFPHCFPSAESPAAVGSPRALPERPLWKDLILDPTSCSVPICEFDEQTHTSVYAPRPDGVEADLPTARPDGFSDMYLMPSLTRNERLRLTMRE